MNDSLLSKQADSAVVTSTCSALERYRALRDSIEKQQAQQDDLYQGAISELRQRFLPLWQQFSQKWLRSPGLFRLLGGYSYVGPTDLFFKRAFRDGQQIPAPPSDEALHSPGGLLIFLFWVVSVGAGVDLFDLKDVRASQLRALANEHQFLATCSFQPDATQFNLTTALPTAAEKNFFSDAFLALIKPCERRLLLQSITDEELLEQYRHRNLLSQPGTPSVEVLPSRRGRSATEADDDEKIGVILDLLSSLSEKQAAFRVQLALMALQGALPLP